MNRTIVILIPLIFYAGCGAGLTVMDEKELIAKGDRMYKPKLFKLFGKEKPYTGKAIKYFEGGEKECEGPYKNGRRDGIWTYWYEPVKKKVNKGLKEGEGPYRIGVREGYWTYWHSNGVKREEGNFQGRERVGKWIYYDENEEKIHEREF